MKYITILCLALFISAACGRIPEPASYDYTTQKKMQASHHWDILAAHVAGEINSALILSEYINSPVYVRETCGDEDTPCEQFKTSVFNETFRDLLISQLVSLGVPTKAEPSEDSIVINYKAQPVYHHRNRLRTVRPGVLTSVTAGILVFQNAPWEMAALATAGALDFANATVSTVSHFEVVITTSMIAKKKYIYRNTNIYYINDKDSWHYNTYARPAEIALTGGPTPPPSENKPLPPLTEYEPGEPMAPAPVEDSTGI